MLVLAVAAACSDSPNKPRNENSPAAVAVTAGEGQVGMPGTMLAAPVKARVTNARGNALANASSR